MTGASKERRAKISHEGKVVVDTKVVELNIQFKISGIGKQERARESKTNGDKKEEED